MGHVELWMIECYYGTVHVTTSFLHPFLFGTNFSLTLVSLLFLIIKVTASYCIASFIF